MDDPTASNTVTPTEEQWAVIRSEEPQILVEAGAGSGKSTTTVDRYIALLDRDPPLEPREILAFTFTDKAAGELRDKVRRARRERARVAGDSSPDAVSMSDAWVGTFHAICNRILKTWPIEAGIDPGFSVLDQTSGETLRKAAFDSALREFCSEDERGYAMVGLFREAPLRGCIQYAYEELRSRGIQEPRLPAFEDAVFPEEHVAVLENLCDEALAGKLTPTRRELLEKLKDRIERRAFSELRLDGKLGIKGRKSEALIEIEGVYSTICEGLVRQEADPVRRQMARLLEIYGEQYSRAKSARSTLDYEDLQLFALRLLRENESIRDFYRERFGEVMVDEFQDTNLLQLELVRELAGNATLMSVGDEMQSIYGFRHADVQLFRDRREEHGVKTYGLTANFRSLPLIIGAVNEIGQKLDEQAPGRLESIPHHEFRKLEVAPDADHHAPASASLILTGRGGWKQKDLGPLAPEGDPEVGKAQDHHYEAEALAVARHLRGLVDDERNGIEQGDIAILLRAKTRTHLYVEALRQFGLTPYVVAGRGFWKSREAIELRALLAVIANPLDDNNLLGALTSPACGMSSDALWLLRKAAGRNTPLWPTLVSVVAGDPAAPEDMQEDVGQWLGQIPEEDVNRASGFVGNIDTLRRNAATLPLDELIDQAVALTGYDLANLLRDPSANGMATIRRAASLAREYQTAEGRSLRGFLDWAELSEQLDTEAPAATADETSDVVRIMTIHAAKGLEFKVACVPDLGRDLTSKHDHAIRLGRSEHVDRPAEFELGLSLPHYGSGKLPVYDAEALKERARISNQDEELRLLHVAMTRAEEHLVLSGILPEKWSRDGISLSSPMITRISKAFELDPEDPENWIGTIEFEEGRIEVVSNLATDERAAELRATPTRVEPRAADDTAQGAPAIVTKKFEVYPDVPLSFSAFSEFVECPTRFDARRVLKLREPGAPDRTGSPDDVSLSGRNRATRFGTAVHNALEGLARAGWRGWGKERIEAVLEEQGLSGRAANGADESELGIGTRMVEDFLGSDLGNRAAAARTGAEVPLLVSYGQVTVRGSADLIIEGEVPMILDYKTNRLDGASPSEKMGPYELQRGLYALALARARDIERVETAYVFLNRADEPVIKTLGPGDFSATEEYLHETLAEITAGHFFGGPDSKHEPCGRDDCIGCAMLAAQISRASGEGS